MTWIISRYIAGRYAAALAWSVAVVLAVIVSGNAIELLREAADAADTATILTIAALRAPTVALLALPFIVMLAAVASFARLARSSELVVTRAAGVSAWALIAPVAALSVLVGAAAVGALNPLAAAAQARADALYARHVDGRGERLSVSGEGVWLRQAGERGQMVIHADAVDPGSMAMNRVTFFEFDDAGAVAARIDARRAELTPGAWALTDAVATRFAAAGDTPETEAAETATVPTDLTRAQILDSFDRPEAISFWRLPAFIAALEAAGFSALRHRLHWQTQLASPLAFLGMAMIGAAFSMRHVRFGGLGMMGLAAVLTGFALYFVTDVAKALGASGAIPVALAAWAPPLATVLISAGLILHLEDG